MTRDEIMSMTPQELRVRIAEALGYIKGVGPMDSASTKYGGFEWWITPGKGRTSILPDWPSDIAAAWGLVEEISDVNIHNAAGVWHVSIRDTKNWEEAETHFCADTAPLAICRAWLLWKLEVQNG